MDISLFDYDLPEDRIAQYPLEKRDDSRMMVLMPATGKISHCRFRDLPGFLNPGDVVVLNRTKVIRARLLGKKANTGAFVEVFLLKELEENLWECLVRPGSRLREGSIVEFDEGVKCELVSQTTFGGRIVKFKAEGNIVSYLSRIGHVPLPPYITRPDDKTYDGQRYQTVYAEYEGSVAAPTAGLHFTHEMLEALSAKGIVSAPLILHVGLGTFQPVKMQKIEEHKMHTEKYMVPTETAHVINDAVKQKRRVLIVGTTAVRALETCAQQDGTVSVGSGDTNLFIYPGYKFKITKSLLTNFHLPRSTLLMMVSALAGREFVLKAYKEAIREGYRFFSYGDCMLILNESKEIK